MKKMTKIETVEILLYFPHVVFVAFTLNVTVQLLYHFRLLRLVQTRISTFVIIIFIMFYYSLFTLTILHCTIFYTIKKRKLRYKYHVPLTTCAVNVLKTKKIYLKLRNYCNLGTKDSGSAWHVIPVQEVNYLRWRLPTITSDKPYTTKFVAFFLNSSVHQWIEIIEK